MVPIVFVFDGDVAGEAMVAQFLQNAGDVRDSFAVRNIEEAPVLYSSGIVFSARNERGAAAGLGVSYTL